MVVEALARNNLFMSAVLPKQVFPPLFNRYNAGMTFGAHVDNAMRGIANSGIRIRTDVSSTLFISAPEGANWWWKTTMAVIPSSCRPAT